MDTLVDPVTSTPPVPPAPPDPDRRRWYGRAASAALRVVPWLLVLAALAAGLLVTGTPAPEVAGYGVYWVLGLLLPGTLVHRALRGSRGNLPEDLGFGAVTGLLLELACWALAAATDQQDRLRWWPAVVVALFAAVPALRRHWRVADPRPLPARWAWATAGAMLLVVGWASLRWAQTPLPPVTHAYYQDLLYHLALVQELTRSMPFEVPQMAGETLRYHYLANAHMASASMITGIAPATVLLRLWVVPVVLVAVLVTAALARDVTGRWWAGPLAGAVTCAGLPLALGAPVDANGGSPVSFASPSQTYALPLVVALAVLCCDVVRSRRLGAAWLLVPALGVACAGAKASALPPLVAGMVPACVVAGWQARRVPWAALAAVGALAGAMAVGYRLFAGGGAGTLAVQRLGILRWMAPYAQTLGAGVPGVDSSVKPTAVPPGPLPPGLEAADTAGRWFVAAVVAWWALMQLPRLVGLTVPLLTKRRADPAAWLLAGAIAAGTGALWLLYHPSASHLYFLLSALPFGVVLSVWLLAETAGRWRLPVAAFAVGAGITLLPPIGPTGPEGYGNYDTYDEWYAALFVPVLRAVVIGVAVALVAALLWRLRRGPGGRPGPALVAGAVAGLLGASVATNASRVVPGVVDLVTGQARVGPQIPAPTTLTEEQLRAALWLDAHAADEDVVATNVHCQPVRTWKTCDARAFWVVGLGGHRAVIESWGYTDQAVAAHGDHGLSYTRQLPPDLERYLLNKRVFAAPTGADLDLLRQRYGVRWLFADAAASPVSPKLAGLAEVQLISGTVTIYELRP